MHAPQASAAGNARCEGEAFTLRDAVFFFFFFFLRAITTTDACRTPVDWMPCLCKLRAQIYGAPDRLQTSGMSKRGVARRRERAGMLSRASQSAKRTELRAKMLQLPRVANAGGLLARASDYVRKVGAWWSRHQLSLACPFQATRRIACLAALELSSQAEPVVDLAAARHLPSRRSPDTTATTAPDKRPLLPAHGLLALLTARRHVETVRFSGESSEPRGRGRREDEEVLRETRGAPC